jgi:hypothetical protein
MDLKDIECECVDWIHLVQDRIQGKALVNMVMKLQAAQKMDFLNNWVALSFSRRTMPHGVSSFRRYCIGLTTKLTMVSNFMNFETLP